jgi:hypothetical protein
VKDFYKEVVKSLPWIHLPFRQGKARRRWLAFWKSTCLLQYVSGDLPSSSVKYLLVFSL